MKKLWILFWEMFKIALCVVGGGFAILAVADVPDILSALRGTGKLSTGFARR